MSVEGKKLELMNLGSRDAGGSREQKEALWQRRNRNHWRLLDL